MVQYRIPVEETFNWQRPVLDRLTTPPGSPSKGDRYLIIATATDDWAGHEDKITWYNGSTWKFDTPSEGWKVWVSDEDVYYVYNGAAWGVEESVATHEATYDHTKLHDPVTVSDTASVDLTLTGQQISADVLPGGVDHDQLSNFVANKHIDHSAVLITGSGLLAGQGGDITSSRTFTLNNSDIDHDQLSNVHQDVTMT